MPKLNTIQPVFMNRMVDFLVLLVTYYLSCLLLSIGSGSELVLQALVYASIVLVCVCFCKVLLRSYRIAVSGFTGQILCNATGILIATLAMLIVGKITIANGELIVALLFSSVMAFFVMGTLSSLVHKNTSLV